MSYILCIETGTDVCSVGLVKGGEVACAELIALRESADGRDHARKVAVFTQEVLEEANIRAAELSAVAVSKGPGSYTGLRIGVSFAKGLCYGLGIPLIGVGSLESLCEVAVSAMSVTPQTSVFHENRPTWLVPMIDARRMEVYCQVFNGDGAAQTPVEALIIDEGSLSEWRGRNGSGRNEGDRNEDGELCGNNDVYIFGSGAEKCREMLPWAHYLDVTPSAKGMAGLAAEAFNAGKFEDTAYFEPFYLKDFVITTSKKKLL